MNDILWLTCGQQFGQGHNIICKCTVPTEFIIWTVHLLRIIILNNTDLFSTKIVRACTSLVQASTILVRASAILIWACTSLLRACTSFITCTSLDGAKY